MRTSGKDATTEFGAEHQALRCLPRTVHSRSRPRENPASGSRLATPHHIGDRLPESRDSLLPKEPPSGRGNLVASLIIYELLNPGPDHSRRAREGWGTERQRDRLVTSPFHLGSVDRSLGNRMLWMICCGDVRGRPFQARHRRGVPRWKSSPLSALRNRAGRPRAAAAGIRAGRRAGFARAPDNLSLWRPNCRAVEA